MGKTQCLFHHKNDLSINNKNTLYVVKISVSEDVCGYIILANCELNGEEHCTIHVETCRTVQECHTANLSLRPNL